MIANGRMPESYLVEFAGVEVAALIAPALKAAQADFTRAGYTFGIAKPWGGNRPYDIQGAMQHAYDTRNYSAYNLSPPPSPRPANPGQSRHGYAKAVDVISNAPVSTRDAFMVGRGFRLWSFSDRNHYEYGDALSSDGLVSAASLGLASSGSTVLSNATTTVQEDDMKFLYVDNDGNGKPFWTLLNTRTGKFFPPVYDQATANGWTQVWGNSLPVSRQQFLNAIAAIQKTS